jgi:hypothetical protein
VSYQPTDLVRNVFNVSAFLSSGKLDLNGDGQDDTLLDALNYQGGNGTTGAAQILLRAAVAALLNAANPNVDYPRTVAEVIADVNAALASGDRSVILALATALDADNNLGCPLNGGAQTPTNTPVPPTVTPTFTPTETPKVTAEPPTPTNTPVPPTVTPTFTPTETPKVTVEPPTPTNTPEEATGGDPIGEPGAPQPVYLPLVVR